ncbi:MAG: pre-peptidase C-terminal domain-containing protein [Cyanobacteriota bacterium]
MKHSHMEEFGMVVAPLAGFTESTSPKPLAYGLGSEPARPPSTLAPLPVLEAVPHLAQQPVIAKSSFHETQPSPSLRFRDFEFNISTELRVLAGLAQQKKPDFVTGITSMSFGETPDYADSISTTGAIAIGGSATGVVNFNGDRDWFRLSLQAGRSYRFLLNGNSLEDPTLALRDARGSQLAFNDDSNGQNSRIDFNATTTGTYFLDAGAYSSGTGSYTLLAADTTPTDDFTANTSTTGAIAIGGSATGVVNFNGDRDWFRLSLQAGITYRFNLNANSLSDPTLTLRNASGFQLAYNDDFNELNSQITFTATTAGTYFLDAGAYSSGTGSYTLLASSVTPTPTTDDFTANTSTTGAIAIGGSATGVVNFNGDRDWFRLSLQAGRTYRFNLNANSLSDPTLSLRNASGSQLAFNDDFDGQNSQLTFSATTAGTYFLDAGDYSSGTGTYTLLAVDTTPTPTSDDFTANTSTNGLITMGGSTTGVVNFNGDRDWFRLSLQAGRIYNLSVSAGSLIDPDFYLRDSRGRQVGYGSDASGTRNAVLTFTPAGTGTFYLDAGSENNVGAGSYTASVIDVFSTDDFTANSSTTGSVAIGGSSSGTLNFGGDRDWFRVSLQARTTYRFNLNGNTLADPSLSLRDINGNQLASNDDFTEKNSQIIFTTTTAGTYFLESASPNSSASGSYTLTAAIAPRTNDDYAADTTSQGRVTVGSQTSGEINFAGDQDWFGVALQTGRTYRFDLIGDTLTNPRLSLLDNVGRSTLASNDDFETGQDSRITFTATSSGLHFLNAAAVDALTGTYLLQVTDVSVTSDRFFGLVDPAIRNSVNSMLSDNLLTHQELETLLRNTGTNSVTSQELADLRAIGTQFSPYLATTSNSYIQYIYNAVVNGNTANQWWTGGASTRVSLGNLGAGSVQLQMNRLVDKWFGGLDLPTNFVGGDTAASASSLTFNYGEMTGSLFEDDISFSDINQGQAGTCYFLAACSTLANNQSQFIRDMFRNNGDGTYGVRFYSATGNELWVTVNQSVPVLPNNRLALARNAARSLTREMWVALVEKAYAQANEIGAFGRDVTANSYKQIEGGLEEALVHISGRSTTTYSAYYSNQGWTTASNNQSTWNNYERIAIAAVNAGRSLLLLSSRDTFDSSGKRNLVSGHAFAITGYNALTGRFIIANPWGAGDSSFAGVFEASWRDLFAARGVVAWV